MSIFSTLLSLHPVSCIFPFYHGVAETTPAFVKHLYPMPSPQQFEKDLDYFLAHFFPISLEDLLNKPGNRNQAKKPLFHLSFDDGLSLCTDPITSILLKKGIPATFFLNADFVGNRDLFFRYKASLLIDQVLETSPPPDTLHQIGALLQVSINSPGHLCKELKKVPYSNQRILDSIASILEVDFAHFLDKEKPYMDESEVYNLIDKGFTIGGHSVDHPPYHELPEEEQIAQSLRSVDYVCKRFDLPYRVFAFPFTDYGVPRSVFESLYAGGIQASFGTAGLKGDVFPTHYQRIPMEKWPYSAPGILRKAFGLYLPKRVLGRHVVKR